MINHEWASNKVSTGLNKARNSQSKEVFLAGGETPTLSGIVEYLIFIGHFDSDLIQDRGDLLIGSPNLLIKH